MDEDLEFCLLKFAEEQQLLHDNERKEQEQTVQKRMTEIRNKEQKLLHEQQMIAELFQEQLMENTQRADHLYSELAPEIIQKLKEDFHYEKLFRTIATSDNEDNWLRNVRKWCDKKFQLANLGEKPGARILSAEDVKISSRRFSSNDSIKSMLSSISDTAIRKQKLIEEFKQKMEKIFIDKAIEFNKDIDEQARQIYRQKAPRPLGSPSVGLFFDTKEQIMGAVAGTPTQGAGNAQDAFTIASLEHAKRQYSEQIEKERKEIILILEASDIDCIPDRISQWLKNQSDEHRHRLEKDRQKYAEKQAQQLVDDQTQTIELIFAFNQLAINSKSADEFKKKLKYEEERVCKNYQELKALDMKIKVPVILLSIDDPAVHKLSVCIRFNEDYEQWVKAGDNKKLDLISSIQKQFNLPEKAFEIIAVESGSVTVRGNVHPPHGRNFLRLLFARKIRHLGGYDTISITLGELNLNIAQEKMNEWWNRNYGNNPGDTHWTGSLDRGGKPYFCPKGWRRFAIKVADTPEEFERRWGTWHIAYHGTANINASAILITGLKTNSGCYASVPVVYVSPSINYSAHHRYAKPWRDSQKPGKYYQMVFQCRVNPRVVTLDKIKPQTLSCPQATRIDEHFTNDEVEWIIYPTDNQEYISDNIICYGIMIRKCDGDPFELPESRWWHRTPYERSYLRA